MPASRDPPGPDPGPPVRRPRAGKALASKVFRRADQPARAGRGTHPSAPVTSPTRPAGTRCTAGTSPAAAHTVATDRPDGTTHATLSADGTRAVVVRRHRRRRVRQLAGATVRVRPRALPREALPTGRGRLSGGSGGRHVRRARRVLRRRRHPHPPGPGRRANRRWSTGTPRTAGSARCPTDETVWVLSHSEHGDSRYPALRALSLPAGDVIGELSDAPRQRPCGHDASHPFGATSDCWSVMSVAVATSC